MANIQSLQWLPEMAEAYVMKPFASTMACIFCGQVKNKMGVHIIRACSRKYAHLSKIENITTDIILNYDIE